MAGKLANKLALQRELGLDVDAETPLIGFVGRLVEQKGVDWILECLDTLLQRGAQLVVLGSGEHAYEAALREMEVLSAGAMAVTIGYSEPLAHRIEAGVDLFLMPSKFEPCGLNQLYSLRYGTVPLVNRVGGLADTVIDATPATLADGSATGFVFDAALPPRDGTRALRATLNRALDVYADRPRWVRLAANGMAQDYSWTHSAQEYTALYLQALAERDGKAT